MVLKNSLKFTILLIGIAITFAVSLMIAATAYAAGGAPDIDFSDTTGGNQGGSSGGGGGGGGGTVGGGGGGPSNVATVGTVNNDCYGKSACHVIAYRGPSSYDGFVVDYSREPADDLYGVTCYNTPDNRLVQASAGFRLTKVSVANYHNMDQQGLLVDNWQEYVWIAQGYNGCGYATWHADQWKTCFYNAMSSGSYSRDLGAIRNMHTSGNKKPLGLSPGTPTSSRYDNCNISYYHAVNVPTDRYGYYSLYLTNQFTSWQRSSLIYNGTVYAQKWEETGRGTQTKYGFYSFSCNANNPYNNLSIGRDLSSTYNSFVNRVNANNVANHLDPANCPQTKGRWECSITDASTIGLDRSTVAGRTNVDNRRVSVMRNGDPVKLTYAAVQISDYDTNGRETIITPGASGSVVRDLQNVNYRDSVVGRGSISGTPSTPWNASADVNSKSQYFIRKNMNGSETTKWGQWVTNRSANDNREYNLSFNWASDPAAPFVAAREYQVTADFLVPSGTSGGLDAAGNFVGAGVTYDWKRDTRQCFQKTGSNGNLVETTNPVFSRTNPVDVLRSTGEN